jgi:pectin methylesterase-like acyl-CoA thioesterase
MTRGFIRAEGDRAQGIQPRWFSAPLSIGSLALGALALALGCAQDPRSSVLPESAAEGARAADPSGAAANGSSDDAEPGVSGNTAGGSLAPGASSSEEGVKPELPLTGGDDGAGAAAAGGSSAPDAGVATLDAGTVSGPPDLALPAGVTSRFPSAGATGVCTDVPLRLSFAQPVTIGNQGRIRIFASANPSTPVDSIDLGAASYTDSIAGRATNLVRPVFLDGQDAVLYFHRGKLAPNTSYYVSIDAGAFVDGSGKAIAPLTDTSWSFTTGSAAAFSTSMVVDREGGGFCTLQSALDAVPANNQANVTIELRNGTYHEIGYLQRKSNVTLHGEDRDLTVIAYPNNDKLNPGTASRALLTALDSNGFVVDNLTIFNTTPQGGSQAEALRVRGQRSILRNGNFKSLQDTLLLEGLVYVADSYVEGNVDFVWGVGTAYFERSEIKIVGRSGVIVQARNGLDTQGYFFIDSKLTSDPNITGSTLARIDVTEYPGSQVAYINCQLGPQISPQGWTVTPAGTTATGSLRFWEFGSTDLDGNPIDVSKRHPASRQLGPAEAASLRNGSAVLGGWDPTQSP